jgi:hypothetical protein
MASISSSDLIDAKLEEHQLCGSKQCPGCGHKLEGKPVIDMDNFLINILSFFSNRFQHTRILQSKND